MAGGVGGHDALHGELDALLWLCLHIRDLGDLGLVEHGDEILADLVVGVVLLRAAVFDLGLHLEVRHEGCAGNNDHALACKLLGRHDHQAVIAVGIGIFQGSAAEAVIVNVHGVGRRMAVDCRDDRCGQRRGRVAVCVYCVDGRAAVVAEAFGVEFVIRMLCIEFHALQKRVLHVVGREVQSPLFDAVGCGALIVIRCIVGDTQAGAEFGQNLVLRRGHMLDVRVVLDDGVILVVVRPTGEDHHAAVVVERLDGVQFFCGIGLRILLGRFQTAGRSRQDDGLVLGIAAGRDEFLAGLQRDCTHGIGRSQFAEVAHGVLIVACNVFVVVRGVNADVDKLACVKHIERDVLGERVLLAVLLDHSRDPDGHDAGLGRGILEFHILRAACSQRDGIRHGADGFAADGIGDGLDGSGLCLTVEERGGDGQFFVGDRGRRAAFSLGNAKLERFADPDGSGHGQIAVALGDADKVIGVLRRQFHADGALGEICGTVPGIGDLAGVDDQLDLGDGIGAVGIVEGDLEVQLLGNVDDGAHHVAVDRVVQIEVLVLGGVHTACSERCIDAVFGKVVGQDDVAGVVGVAPAALVVILVVGRGDVPALVERHDVLLVAGIIAACADLAFAVADFDHVHTGVNDSIPVTEVNEVAERRARMVELADGIDALCLRQKLVVGLQASILGLVVERRVVAGDDAGGIEGVDMAGTAGPRHFKARNGDHAACIFFIERSDRALILIPEILARRAGKAHVIERALGVGCAGLVKVVGMVGERDEVNVRAVRQRLDIRQCAFQRASAVGILRVGVQLAEVALEGRLADGEGPGLAGFLVIRTLDRHSYRDLAVRHSGSRGVGDLAVRVDSIDLFTVDSHRYAGVLASVRDLRGDRRLFVLAGLRALRGRYVGDHGLVEDVDGAGRSGLVALDILERKGQGHLAADLGCFRDIRIKDRDMDAALAGGEAVQNLYVRVALQLAEIAGDVRSIGLLDTVLDPRIVDFIDCVDLEFKLVIAADIGREHGFGEGDGGLHDEAAVHIHALRHGIEEEGVDCIVKIAGLAVHAVDLERVGEILQPLAVAAELRRAALQLIAAHAAGAGTDEPVRVFGRNALFGEVLAVERVVAGAVGTEIAIRIALEAEVFAVRLDGEHDCAVRWECLAALDFGVGLFDGLGIVLRRQNRLRVLVVDHEPVAGLGQIAGGRRRRVRNIVRAAAVAELIGSVMCRAAGIQGDHVGFLHICSKRNALEQILGAGFICDGRIAVLVVCTERYVLDVDIFAQVIRAHLRNCDLLCGNGVQTALDHFGDTAGLELRNAAIGGSRARDLYNIANYIFCIVGIVINLVAINLAVDHVFENDRINAGRILIVFAIMVHDLTNDRDRAACLRCRFLDVQCTLRDHVVRNGVINVAVQLNFFDLGVSKLKLFIVDADSRRNIQLVADLVFPFALSLVDHSLIKLNGLAVCVFDGDIRLLKAAIVIIDLCDLHAADGDVGTDVCRRQSADGGALCAQRQTAGLLECSGAKLRKAVVSIPLACADDCITERNFCRLAGQPEADATGCILQIIILPVNQRHNALDGEGGVLLSGKRRTDGNRGGFLSLDGVGERHGVAVDHVVLRGLDGEGDVFLHGRLCALGKGLAVRSNEDLRTLSLAGERDRCALVYFARSRGSSRGCDLLLGCVELPEVQRLARDVCVQGRIAAPILAAEYAHISRQPDIFQISGFIVYDPIGILARSDTDAVIGRL